MSIEFSVTIPAYDCAHLIGETLEAILSQTLPPAEVVIVDDGSTDDTRKEIMKFGDRVIYHHTRNSGAGAARKTAISLSHSNWIAPCDSDDVWMSDHLARRAALIEHFPAANFTFSDFDSIGQLAFDGYSRLAEAPPYWLEQATQKRKGDFVLFKDTYRAFLKFNPAFPSGWALRRDIYHLAGGINPRYKGSSEDTDLMRRILLLPQAVVAGDTRVTWSYRRHGSNVSVMQWKNLLAKAVILNDHLHENIVPDALKTEVYEEMIGARIDACNMAFWEGAYRDSLDIYRQIPHNKLSMKMHLRALMSKLRA